MDKMRIEDESEQYVAGGTAREAYRTFEQVVTRQPQRQAAALDRLARLAQAGDLAARNALYLQMEPVLLRLAAPVLREMRAHPAPAVEQADVRQEIFVAFCALLRDWQPGRAPFAGYAGRVLPHRLRHYLRRTRRPRETSLDAARAAATEDADNPAEPIAPHSDPAAIFATRDLCATLLDALDPPARLLVVLHVLEGRPLGQAAAALGVSERTAWRMYAAARATMHARLAALAPAADMV
ncbi:MAG TPA: sigma-70 family RNA polymerase sigma factor [Chloroflexia bacterium]|jgi:RNA polymerase sigma factor (sigma-70 family)|nr:sigma-70 family RNA polymerase sigma factor [Chloroflexia bacterium]